MLDNNTDRMWFVIGALVVGAGIILVTNKAFPEVYASVLNQYESLTNQGVKDTKNIKVYANLLTPEEEKTEWISNYEFLRTVNLAPIADSMDKDQHYTLRFDIKSLDTSQYNKVRVYTQNSQSQRYLLAVDGWTRREDWTFEVTEDWQKITIENMYFVPSEFHYNSTPDAYLAFYGTYGTNNAPVVKNLQLIPTY